MKFPFVQYLTKSLNPDPVTFGALQTAFSGEFSDTSLIESLLHCLNNVALQGFIQFKGRSHLFFSKTPIKEIPYGKNNFGFQIRNLPPDSRKLGKECLGYQKFPVQDLFKTLSSKTLLQNRRLLPLIFSIFYSFSATWRTYLWSYW